MKGEQVRIHPSLMKAAREAFPLQAELSTKFLVEWIITNAVEIGFKPSSAPSIEVVAPIEKKEEDGVIDISGVDTEEDLENKIAEALDF